VAGRFHLVTKLRLILQIFLISKGQLLSYRLIDELIERNALAVGESGCPPMSIALQGQIKCGISMAPNFILREEYISTVANEAAMICLIAFCGQPHQTLALLGCPNATGDWLKRISTHSHYSEDLGLPGRRSCRKFPPVIGVSKAASGSLPWVRAE
jgi:hypothetical protein